ncbi:hypothetical protein ALC57_08309 [Trachymyrmex cornetzi]|uniref:Uncharacterized protein n=1 Tax=Trachymyrmex cornetzi TaxID=471704 RepID=A0A151J717_9HYME|nr:hypothetical protein ALC57_08309 [Trachymyrmex cornetzi]
MPSTTNNINSTLVNVSSSRDKETPRISARLHPTVTWKKTENSQKITAPFLPSSNLRPEESLWFFNQPLKEITHRSKATGCHTSNETLTNKKNSVIISPSRARPIGVPTATGQPNRRPARRVHWHRPNQINIPPLRGFLQPSRLTSSFFLRRSSFLLRLRGRRVPRVSTLRLQFASIPGSTVDRDSSPFLLHNRNAIFVSLTSELY